MSFLVKHLPLMNEQELTSMFFLYAHNMWEAQERYTYESTFFTPLFDHLVSEVRMRQLSNQSLTNIVRSIGTMCYRNQDVDTFLAEAKRRAEISKELIAI
jgi:hypothetical protein